MNRIRSADQEPTLATHYIVGKSKQAHRLSQAHFRLARHLLNSTEVVLLTDIVKYMSGRAKL